MHSYAQTKVVQIVLHLKKNLIKKHQIKTEEFIINVFKEITKIY